jgi:phage tail sheath protein FI
VLVSLDAGAAISLQTLGDPSNAAWDTSVYNLIKTLLLDHYITVPPSGAVAGVYAAVDSSRGVWKAPANVGVADVVEPMVRLDNAHQDELNVDPTTGKSINALRAFAGKGVLVWGARTLAGNDNEWRYVPVRRFFNMVEESVKKSSYWAVFEPNDANTWIKVRGMIENYLTQKWRDGALAGATTKDAFFVRCGLGTTMNAQDILEGRMNVEIGMAVVRPAEFIILKFSHKLQTS